MTNTVQDADQAVAASELDVLKVRAATLGIKHHPSIGLDKLREKVTAALTDTPPPIEAVPEIALTPAETQRQANSRLRREAGQLVRVRVSCMNPMKREWDGEVFTASNSVVGSYKKFVPFDNDAGWHVPQIVLNMMKERMCQIFVPKKGDKGRGKEGKLIREFAIEIMAPLTGQEITDLAAQQALGHTIDV